LGTHPPYRDELQGLGRAVAMNEGIAEAATALQVAANEHALYDASGVIGFFAVITRIVDFTGHYYEEKTDVLFKIGGVLSAARRVRHLFFRPWSLILSYIVNERKQPRLEKS